MADITLTLNEHEFSQIIHGLNVAAEDYAYRLNFEERLNDPDPDELAEYRNEASCLSDLATELERRRDA